MRGLSDLRVIDFSTGIAGPYATKLLADGGADVIKVEPPDGDPLRRWSATGAALGEGDGALFRYLNTSKRSVIGTPGEAHVEALVADADLIVESWTPGMLEATGWLGDRGLVVMSISPYGRGGPMDHRPATEFIVQAESGGIACRGRPDQPPVHAGGRISDYTTGSYAAPAALAAVRRARLCGVGEHVDLSMVETMAIAFPTFQDLAHSMHGNPPLDERSARSVETPSIEPALDGWVGFNTNTGQQFQAFLLMIERPDLLDDADLATFAGRTRRIDEWNEIVRAWTTRHTVAEILERAAELRIPSAQVHSGKTVLDDEHLSARGVFVPNPAGFLQPRPPYLVDGRPIRAFEPAPRLGEHTGTVEERPRPAGGTGDPATSPFAGLRVLDLTSWWAGPSSTHVLAMLGADVVHVESTSHPDGMRMTGYMFGRPAWWEWGHMFVAANTNKRGITVDLDQDDGLDLARRLIASADVVVENFSPRVMEKFGLDRAGVQALNPSAVYMRMPAFGLSGPWRDRVGFAQTMEQMTGMAWITGHVDDQPRIMRGPCDPIAGMHGAFALMVALHERDVTGRGVFVESTMVEAALNCAAEQIVEYTAYGNLMERAGNRGPHARPQGIYRCAGGPEEWVAVSVETDAQWAALVGLVGCDDADRHDDDGNDRILGAWAASRTVDAAVDALVAVAVPAGRVVDPRVAHQQPQMAARRFFEVVEHPEVGAHPVPGMPYRWRSVDRWVERPSPTLGQHTREVLAEWLGVGDPDLGALEAAGIIGTRPSGM